MTPLKSSNLKGYHYDPATKVMTVHFKAGGDWEYHGVDPKHVEGLTNAESAGKYFNTHIRGHTSMRAPAKK